MEFRHFRYASIRSKLSLLALTCFSTLALAQQAIGPVTGKDVVYQILTDRFYDGDSTNNIPTGSPSQIFDGTGSDLKLYQGGDFQGIIDKIPYLKNMGVTAVWISAPYANRDEPIIDYQSGGGQMVWSSYHGYHVSNYYRTNAHFGDMKDFTDMVNALHNEGIKVVIDFVSNHSSRWQNPTNSFAAENGKLYEPDRDGNGNFVFDGNGNPVDLNSDGSSDNLIADPNGTTNPGWFHSIGDRGTDSSRFGYRYRDLGSLADFTHELPEVVAYLEGAATFWKGKGIDGYRHDATLHMNPAFAKGFRDAIDSAPGGAVTHFGEFFIGKPDPKYGEYESFPDRTGINNLDFEYFRTLTNVIGNGSQNMQDLASFYQYTDNDYAYENQTVTFIDNHDVPRFLRVNSDQRSLDVALALTLTSRGIPNIYYGTEQYVNGHDGSENGGRVFMQTDTSFSQTTRAYKIIQKLSALRQQNDALAYGQTSILYSSADVLVMSRKFYDKQVIIAVNRSPYNSYTVPTLSTSMAAGNYTDVLTGELGGSSVSVSGGQLASFQLSQQEVNVWSYDPNLGTAPKIGDMQSTIGRSGNQVKLFGTGLDGSLQVKFDTTNATVVANDYHSATVTIPAVAAGSRSVSVVKGGVTSNTFAFEVLSDDQNQMIFHVVAYTQPGEQVYVVGNIPELGNWDPAKALDAFHNPNPSEWWKWFLPVSVPKGTNIQFKYIIKDSMGNVTWESGANRSASSSAIASGVVDLPLHTFQ
ncbi:alpha-amylase family glycosyl hydrolase [Bowmanella yangjiangensis]|uniref:Alpha amylase C-terminal domain-containing protein n=1 Tax=Bowmanella yangjiangensis TaxID=2811230 RepID=A0ABS3CTD8_9ALTE|nr:alpha-amylase family glycosyl hydrolase [Bowmanella yangjiangensis]MBN7819550.1 alpha amylase C-terminal domain-containing protein [Bowmanella yangjiangensis]